ncbi:MAG: GTP 3',8-cyclase MoaA [Sutterellaceae bacterium]|nr:GTP 3',8-cyclase MoaA [Sutterellaceae bacterium]MDD7441919.1 GTP 3',8-cyclase MoaA [Sutterellaceae bacterium]MDY2868845.1 GTP 3',8-cyclase MoaA [Mesosutterella sp.]
MATQAPEKADRRTIPILPEAPATIPIPFRGEIRREDGHWLDLFGRPLTDLRISVTDHCNFRCRYCKPKEIWDNFDAYLPYEELLSFEELFRISRIAVANGVRKIRLTGGEPLLRRHVEELVALLRALRTPSGDPIDIAMTTNGSILAKKAKALKAAGLDRLTVSLDAMDERIFQSFNDVGFPVAKVLEGIRAAQEAGFTKIKVNTVVKRGVNEGEIIPLLEHFKGTGIIVRFIEYMDAGSSNGWKMDQVVPTSEVLRIAGSRYKLRPLTPNYASETAQRWQYGEDGDEFGCISSVTRPFCRNCSRARLSIEGAVYLCLFAERGFDIRTMLRGGASDEEITEALGRIWSGRTDHYSELRQNGMPLPARKVEMSYIGG